MVFEHITPIVSDQSNETQIDNSIYDSNTMTRLSSIFTSYYDVSSILHVGSKKCRVHVNWW